MGYTSTHKKRDGSVEYRRDGALHRHGGPALIGADGTKSWYEDGLLHREGGPAVQRPDGATEWWHHGLKTRASVSAAFETAQEGADAADDAGGAGSKAGIPPVRRFQLNMHKR